METPSTLSFDVFWRWLMTHPNCIVRAGTPEAVLYDDDDLHWHFASYDDGTLGVQLLRGKRFAAELVVDPAQVTYVQGTPGDVEGEHVFDLFQDSDSGRQTNYFFVLTHGYDEEPSLSSGQVH